MNRYVIVIACAGGVAWSAIAQEAPKPASPAKSATVIGCLAGPDSDNFYTLTSMQHRTGLMVAGGEELKKGAGAKVKLTGSWETLPGADAKSGDAGKRFHAKEIVVVEEKCQAPEPVTPVSKKKQAPKN